MSDYERMVQQFMAALVARAGGVDATVALIGARLGAEPSKGSISKRLAGQLSWPIEEVWALEDALGDAPVSRWRGRALPEEGAKVNLLQALGASSRETGEAQGAVMEMIAGEGSKERALKELAEAKEAIEALIGQVEGSRRG
ncbi:hypothetical protein [Fuscibacter oryzae]|uniref:Uncharacterized protein n=1 Tax=Fuscibacter oryzae TaxID=2803939 RepID=A0A8J7MS70_9RHOB|nr:hypothetical protein [Fuscibacter oryzae]MBL4929358.1 hypothetical protein [Fuscibacter oryzae]